MSVLFILLTFVSLSLQSFIHPGLLVTEADITRASNNLNRAPWNTSYAQLTACSCASTDYEPSPVSAVYRATTTERAANTNYLWNDAAAAFALALRWKLTNNDSYAETASGILTAWAAKLVTIDDTDDGYLTSGFQGHELANAAELLRDYAPFAEDGLDAVKTFMTSVFLPMNLDFLNHKLGSEHNVKHFFANWELGNLASAMAIAVLTENSTVWDFAIEYFKSGSGNGNINNAVTDLHIDPDTGLTLGQGQESGRDQGHSALDWQMLGVIGQQAWNQGVDLFSYNNSRILQGAEYFARYNLGHDVPFNNYTNGIVSFDCISNASRGSTRPTWELFYSHYVQIKGMDAPWTTAYLNYSLHQYGGVEPGAGLSGSTSGAFDGLGWGSLLYHRDDNDTTVPSYSASLTASRTSRQSAPATTISTTQYSNSSVVTFSTSATSQDGITTAAISTATHLSALSLSQSVPQAHRHNTAMRMAVMAIAIATPE
ncbi:hypothetical protein PFICI_10497 [Pestalotiopsis fici W106-1]|uniref:Alginate lyase domain-containing protein n=1 Tax=Pestalotiopsis fici (strain W106-1 / CGMCC3.15140) TaxID=1229662 RepID=W3WX58_PESFW|nr:uncharacterized protein PFICI_10497 [Pestalotiopsis fici W106-1]ETS78435.1 hypothetical protein PFICI_10497 [Pestalotiopsis fici W106-1]